MGSNPADTAVTQRTYTPVPVPTDDPPETPSHTETPLPVWLTMSAKPLSKTAVLDGLFWERDELPENFQPVVESLVETNSAETRAAESTFHLEVGLGPISLVEDGGTYYLIEREVLEKPVPLEYEITFTAISTCAGDAGIDGADASAEAISLASLSASDRDILPSQVYEIFEGDQCGSFAFWHEFETHEQLRTSSFSETNSFSLEYQGEVALVSAKPARYAMHYGHYRYVVTQSSASITDFEIPASVVAEIDPSSLVEAERTSLEQLLDTGYLSAETSGGDAFSANRLKNRLKQYGQHGPEKLSYFEVDGSYYAFDFWYQQG